MPVTQIKATGFGMPFSQRSRKAAGRGASKNSAGGGCRASDQGDAVPAQSENQVS